MNKIFVLFIALLLAAPLCAGPAIAGPTNKASPLIAELDSKMLNGSGPLLVNLKEPSPGLVTSIVNPIIANSPVIGGGYRNIDIVNVDPILLGIYNQDIVPKYNEMNAVIRNPGEKKGTYTHGIVPGSPILLSKGSTMAPSAKHMEIDSPGIVLNFNQKTC